MQDLTVDQYSTRKGQHSTTHIGDPTATIKTPSRCNLRQPTSLLHSKWLFLYLLLSACRRLQTLKKLCEKDPTNWDKYLNQVLASYRITPNLVMVESPFFLLYGRDPNLPLHQLLEPMQCFLGDPDSGMLNLETHRLALAKKTLDENRFTATQETMAWDKPAFQIGDCVYFKKKQPGKWDLKWRPRYRIVCIECNRHFIHIKNQATGKIWSCNVTDIILEPPIELWNIETQFSRAGGYIKHLTNLPTIKLMDN